MNSVPFKEQEIFPSKVICVGRNYGEHIEELHNEIPEEPVIFIKPNSSLSPEIHAGREEQIHYEGEITFLLWEGEIEGVGFGLDLTKREVQSRLKAKGLPWERAKAFDRSAVFSRFVSFDGDVNALRMELIINGRLIQAGGVPLMLNKPADLLKEVKSFITPENGDLLMTGTPKGVGGLKVGDRYNGKIYCGDRILVEAAWVVR